ncbi:WYL domain-containing protein [Salinivibrio sp. ML323]|uniref:helix-turn-helix transcriptional regulator n=1 Tax=Salinivibrio sp. ML323 TaxID=1909474 RepID=UPI000987C1C4|nr:WYL domain-containing protein [Salinivibrio sp. ML323]OOE59539.1 WYL domain-containing protein [Salinivibrio sp. ML323]
MKQLEQLPHAQRERLAFIDFSLSYFGEVARADLIAKFQTGLAAATRDFSTYKELAPYNLELIHQSKSYHRTAQFVPLFEHDPDTILMSLCRGFGDGFASQLEDSQVCVQAQQLNKPSTDILSAIMRAIHQQTAIKVEYVSLNSGASTRAIVPHSLANNGNRWHVRAYDRSTSSFRDFVLTRIKSSSPDPNKVDSVKESVSADKQWNRIVDLTFIAHPAAKHPEAIWLDYNMVDGKLQVECRAALAGYLLNQWNVDCSSSYHLNPQQYQLALEENAAIYGVETARLAPGYEGNEK